jgi:CBS domain-containing protein
MSPRRVSEDVIREVPLLMVDQDVRSAVETLMDGRVPALPVVDGRERLAGVFGEREFMEALFPGYVKQLGYAGFVGKGLEDALEKRAGCASERVGDHMLAEHVDVSGDFSDVQVAETFLHHRVLIVPVVDNGRVAGVITRSDFFRSLAGRFLER